MTLDNMTGITKGSYTGFCKSQLITCNFAKACNGVCPFEDALKHADKRQTMDEQHIINHDKDWIIGCIEHDGFIKTHRFDKANQIILDALSADRPTTDCTKFMEWLKAEVLDEENWELNAVANGEIICRKFKKMGWLDVEDGYYVDTRPTGEWIPVSERLPIPHTFCLVTTDGSHGDVIDIALYMSDGWHKASEVLAWMPLPEPYKGGESDG